MTLPQALKCPSCNASLDYDGRAETVRCDYCGTTIIVPESMRAGGGEAGYVGTQSPKQAEQIHHILELVRDGNKIEAIKLYRETFNVGLKEAKDIVDHLEMGQPTAMTVTYSPSKAYSGCSCLISLIIFLAIGVGVLAAVVPAATISRLVEDPGQTFQQIAAGDFESIESIVEEAEMGIAISNRGLIDNPIAVTSGGDGLGADLLLRNYRYGGNATAIMLSYTEETDGRRTTRWETEIGDTGSNLEYNVGYDNQHVYLANGTTLRALARSSGEQAWQANLSDIVDSRCLGCLRVEQGVVVALTADNTLYGLNANTGQQLWQARLTSDTARYLDEGFVGFAFISGHVVLLDESEQAGAFGFGLKVYDVQTGELVHELVPMCPDIDNFFDPAPIGYYNQVFVDEGQDTLFILYGENINGSYCLEQWDPIAATPIWQTRLPGEATTASSIGGGMVTEWSGSPVFAFNGETLLIPTYESGTSQGIALANLSSGEIPFYLPEADYELWPMGVQGDTAVVWAERQRGTTQVAVWGLDAATGSRKWEHPLQAEYLFELDPFDDQWSYALTPDGLHLFQLFATPDPPELLVQTLDIQNGSIRTETKNNLADDYWEGIVRTGDNVYLNIRSLVEVDLQSGQAAVEWP